MSPNLRPNELDQIWDKLPKIRFSAWHRWTERERIEGKENPGLYLLARQPNPGKPALSDAGVIYVGETGKPLESRWWQFHARAFEGGKSPHSGGKNYQEDFGDGPENVWVAAMPVNLDVLSGFEGFQPSLLCKLFVTYVKRKLILEFALIHGQRPKCNRA